MTNTIFFEKIKKVYSSAFNITEPYTINDHTYLGYAYFWNNASRYVLMKKAKLWEANSFEHVIFMEERSDISSAIEHAIQLIKGYMEHDLVRKGNKYPEQNHMYSFLTVVIITDLAISPEQEKEIKKFHFTKNYLFSIRGYSQGRIILTDPSKKIFISNSSGNKLYKMYSNLFE